MIRPRGPALHRHTLEEAVRTATRNRGWMIMSYEKTKINATNEAKKLRRQGDERSSCV
jgi:hypothetical protein